VGLLNVVSASFVEVMDVEVGVLGLLDVVTVESVVGVGVAVSGASISGG
jgi:hypothetical protein